MKIFSIKLKSSKGFIYSYMVNCSSIEDAIKEGMSRSNKTNDTLLEVNQVYLGKTREEKHNQKRKIVTPKTPDEWREYYRRKYYDK